ncbi:MAG: hypothetical protein J7L90_02905, partial [Dehalococcoidia bacterium]|nr:hypothetical protein [Dehalococcoidia bacterium]
MKRFIPIALILILLGLVLTPVVGYASEEDGAKTVVTVKPKPVSKPVKLIPTDDSYLGESSKDHNNGTKPFLAVRSYAQRDKRIIMQFQPKEVGSVALSPGRATLHLYVSGAKGTSVIEVRPFKSPGGKWEEKLVEWY